MKDVLVDSSVILDVFLDDPQWGDWSEGMLAKLSRTSALLINTIIYTEISIGFERIEELEKAVSNVALRWRPFPKKRFSWPAKRMSGTKSVRGKGWRRCLIS
jgi:predicted nucleic acid-binding protein